MTEKKENVITHSMHSGLILGGLLSVRDFLVQDVFNGSLFAVLLLSLAGFAVSVYCIFFFTKKYNREVLNNEISYWKALQYAFYMFFFAGMIVALFAFIFFRYINPDYLGGQGEMFINLLKQLNPPAEAMKPYEDLFGNMPVQTPANAALNTLWSVVFNGFIIALFTSLFFRKRENIQNDKT
jgi:hypothetical protein